MKKREQNRPGWWRVVRGLLRPFFRRPKFVFTGRPFAQTDEPFILLSNHVGPRAPFWYELFLKQPFQFWGVQEMTQGVTGVCRYLSRVYLHRKKRFPRGLAGVVAFIICPFVALFCKGSGLIPTFPGRCFKKTISESLRAMRDGQSLIIFPEDSSDGYHDRLTAFLPGFAALGDVMRKKGQDVLLYCAYYRKKDRTFVVSEPMRFSALWQTAPDKRQIAALLCEKTNRLAEMDVT